MSPTPEERRSNLQNGLPEPQRKVYLVEGGKQIHATPPGNGFCVTLCGVTTSDRYWVGPARDATCIRCLRALIWHQPHVYAPEGG